jgi:hypothetical protein
MEFEKCSGGLGLEPKNGICNLGHLHCKHVFVIIMPSPLLFLSLPSLSSLAMIMIDCCVQFITRCKDVSFFFIVFGASEKGVGHCAFKVLYA